MSCTEMLMLVLLPWLQSGLDFFSILTPAIFTSLTSSIVKLYKQITNPHFIRLLMLLRAAPWHIVRQLCFMRTVFCSNTYMWFVSATIHMVWMMCFEEAHQSVNLKENSSGRYRPLFKTNQREREGERGDSKRSKISSSQRWRGWFRGGIKALPHCGASFYKVHHITSASHFHRYIIICLPPKPGCYACVLCLKQD